MASICHPLIWRSLSSPYSKIHAVRKCLKLAPHPLAVTNTFVPCCSCGTATLPKENPSRGSRKMHWYHQLVHPWKNLEDFKSDLMAAKIYEDSTFVVFNKPHGPKVSSRTFLPKEEIVARRKAGELALYTVIPAIEEELNTRLFNVYAPSRDCSGVTVYAKSSTAVSKIRKYWHDVKANQRPAQKYWAICLGLPVPDEEEVRFGLWWRKVGDVSVSMMVESASSRKLAKGKAISPTIHYKTIQVNRDLNCSLVELTPSNVKWDSMQCLLVDRLCPVLGDHTYSSRLKYVMDQPVLADPQTFIPETQDIPKMVAKQLELKNNDFELVPLHIHCLQLVLPDYQYRYDSKSRITVMATPGDFFQRTLDCLGLNKDLPVVEQGRVHI